MWKAYTSCKYGWYGILYNRLVAPEGRQLALRTCLRRGTVPGGGEKGMFWKGWKKSICTIIRIEVSLDMNLKGTFIILKTSKKWWAKTFYPTILSSISTSSTDFEFYLWRLSRGDKFKRSYYWILEQFEDWPTSIYWITTSESSPNFCGKNTKTHHWRIFSRNPGILGFWISEAKLDNAR